MPNRNVVVEYEHAEVNPMRSSHYTMEPKAEES